MLTLRLFLTTLLITALWCSSSYGQYTVVLETGDTLLIKEYYTMGDSLGFDGGRVAKSDVFMLQKGRELYMFRYRSGNMVRFKHDAPRDTCWFAKAYATKYEGSDTYVGPTLLIDSAMTRKAAFICCYREVVYGDNLGRMLRTASKESKETRATYRKTVLEQIGGGLLSAPSMAR